MGISGLYKWLDSIKRVEHVKKYSGKVLGVDTYSWLHKGAFSCALELVQGTPTTRYVDYCVERIKMLQHYGIKPYLVFDGDYLPSKAGTEEGRESRREESRQKGLELLATNRSAAMDILQKAVDVTPLMARHVIEACKKLGVSHVVAPYEADAQLYYLEKTGVIDGVISEDSDLLVFGVRLLITKMGRLGDCVEVNREDFTRCKDISLAGWTDAEFRMMAILSGCDYLPSIKGIGIKKAHSYVRGHKTIERIIRAIRLDGKMSVPAEYLEKFKQAELTFLHQRVWCPKLDMMVMCTEPEEPLIGEALVFIGGEVDVEIARGVARGDLDPITKKPFNLQLMPSYTFKSYPAPAQIQAKSSPRPNQTLKPKVSIASFFAASAATPPPRTPLQTKSANIQVIRKAFTAPRPGTSTPIMKKRTNPEETAKTDVPMKKSRLFGPGEDVIVTGERSSFFNTPKHKQSRRPIGDISSYKSPLPVDSIRRSISSATKLPSETPVKKQKLATELSDLERAIQASLLPEYAPALAIDEDTAVQKVARSLKVDFAFKQSPPGIAPRKLVEFVEKQRVNAGGVQLKSRVQTHSMGKSEFMQQFRKGSGAVFKKPAQIPHTVGAGDESQDSTEGGSGEDWPDFRTGEDSQSQDQRVFGGGDISKFILKR